MNDLKKVIFSFVVMVQCPLFAQIGTNFFADTTQHISVSLGANYNYGSSVMNNEFMNKFVFGGKIEREHKDKAYNNLSEKNRLGGDVSYSFNIEIPLDTFFKRPNISLVLGIENSEHVDAQFTSDLFKFTFDGNKQFAGEIADISGTNFNYYKYQQLNIGLVNYKYFENKLAKEGVTLSIIKAEEHKTIGISEGSVFTEELGREIDVDLNYLYQASDTAKKGIGAFNGVGASIDLFTEFYLKNGDKIYVGMSDIGFVSWNNNSMDIRADSTFHFEGVEVDNIFDLNDSLVSNILKDSIIDDLSTSNEKRRHTTVLPASVNINYTKVLNEKWKINVGVYHKILANYFPLISANAYYYSDKKFVARAHLSYGGYGKLNTGLAFSKSVKKYFDIFIGTNNIEALIVPNSSYANSGFVGLKAYIK